MGVFCGIDWAEDHHDIALVDRDGTLLAKRRIGDDTAGFGTLLQLLAEAGDAPDTPIPVAIETSHGLLSGMADVADRLAYLDARCRDSGRDPAVLRRAVALRRPRDGDVAALTDLGVDELVIVESPPADPRRAAEWVSSLADRWLPTETSPA